LELQKDNKESFTQTEMFAKELLRLKLDITPSDREGAMKELFIKSSSTISQYLNGKVRDNDTAASLIKYFKTRIKARSEVLE
jgi:hypothetical protein